MLFVGCADRTSPLSAKMEKISRLQSSVAELPQGAGIVVGLSGGMDSVVLLHAVKQCLPEGGSLRALHVNHGLQAEANEWGEFCRDLCRKWNVPLTVCAVSVAESGASLENRARVARYEAFSENLRQGECLLLAHHLDDQMETMLLRLARGAGTRGLSGIPQRRKLGKGTLVRPLLHCPNKELAEYAKANDLHWIEDASNQNTDFDRNFCRHEILPVIGRRWPDFRNNWERSRELIAESQELLDDLAGLDLERCTGNADNVLQVEGLRQLSKPRRQNALRHWIESAIGEPADWKNIQRVGDCLLRDDQDVETEVTFPGYHVRRFGKELYLVPDLPPVDSDTRIIWDPSQEPVLELPDNGSLHAIPATDQGLAGKSYEVRYRQGGETCRLARRPTKSLKKILNESRIEPWLRERLPLLFHNNELAAVPGIGITENATENPGYRIEWRSPD